MSARLLLFRRVLVVTVAASGVLMTPSGPASAHTELVSSTPAAGVRLQAPPREVVLTFNEPVSPALTTVSLTVGGRSTELSVAQGPAGDLVATVGSLPPQDAAQRWTVAYRVASRDGHPVTGSFDFRVADAAAPSHTPTTTAPAPSLDTSPPGTRGDSSSDGRGWLVGVFLTAFLLSGLLVVATRRLSRRDGGEGDQPSHGQQS